jgi:hypothetical protein
MPFVGLGLHVLIALFFAVHAMRHGKQMYWLIILFSFPLLGSVVYFVVEYLPASRMQRTAGKVASAAIGFIGEREYRAAAEAYDLAPPEQAAPCQGRARQGPGGRRRRALPRRPEGPLASDPELQFGHRQRAAGRGRFVFGPRRAAGAPGPACHARRLPQGEVAVLNARALAADGRQAEAREAFEAH